MLVRKKYTAKRICGVLIDRRLLNYRNDDKEEEEEEEEEDEGSDDNDEEESDDEDEDEEKYEDEGKDDKEEEEEEEEEVDVTKLMKAFQNLREMRDKLKKAPSAPEILHAINDIVEESCNGMGPTNLVFHGSMKNLQDSYKFADRYYNLDMTHWGKFMSSVRRVMRLVVRDDGVMEKLAEMDEYLPEDLHFYVNTTNG